MKKETNKETTKDSNILHLQTGCSGAKRRSGPDQEVHDRRQLGSSHGDKSSRTFPLDQSPLAPPL